MKTKYLILLLAFLVYNCASVKNIEVDSKTTINQSNLQKLEGTFLNHSYESSDKYDHTIWGILFAENYSGKYMQHTKIKIDLINQKRLKISLLDSIGKPIRMRKKGGKLKDGCFYLNRKYMFYPFAPIVFGSTNRVHKLCISDENLSIAYAWNIWGFAMINGINHKGSFVSKHKRQLAKK